MTDTVGALLAKWADKTPDSRYLLCGDSGWITYAEMFRRSERVAAGLQRLGVAKGDRIAYLLPNTPEAVVLFYACAHVGAVNAPLNTFLRGEFLRHQLEDLRPTALILDALGADQVKDLRLELPELTSTIIIGSVEGIDTSGLPGRVVSYGELESDDGAFDFPHLVPSDICSILYTGGTTGLPKGCLIPHSYINAVMGALGGGGWAESGDTVLTSYPTFHMGGIYATCLPLYVGGALVYESEFHASTTIARARETGTTVLYGMGAMAMLMLAQPPHERDRDHDIRLGFYIPLTAEAQERFTERFNIPVICELYGQTECVPVAHSHVRGERRPGSAGKVQPNFEVKLVDDNDREVEPGEIGEIAVRPREPGVMFAGYWNDTEATVAVSRNLWHHTGDFGQFDDDGFLYFADRKKDALRRRGEFVSSLELEQAILTHPDITAVAVHAVPSDMTDDDIKACIALVAGKSVTPDQLFQFFRERLPYFAIPRYVEVFDQLPATAATIRVQKAHLRQRGITAETWDFDQLGLVVPRDERRKSVG